MILIIFLHLALTQPTQPTHPTLEEQYKTELTHHAEDFLSKVRLTRGYAGRLALANVIIPIVVKHCLKYDVDPLQAAVVIMLESSWGWKQKGALGEVGPMQVMPKFFKQFNLTTIDGQIEAGIQNLAKSKKICGENIASQFQYYGTNRCKPISGFARLRQLIYYRAIKRYRKEEKTSRGGRRNKTQIKTQTM